MKKLIKKFGWYNVAVFGLMALGVLLFVLTPFFIWAFDLDTDIIGVLIFILGLILWAGGLLVRAVRKK
jgi:hypothetical protein